MKLSVITLGLLIILSAGLASAELVTVGQLGYHPDSHKRVVVYTSSTGGEASILQDGSPVATYPLGAPLDANGDPTTCQGEQQCLIAEFTDFTSPGTYTIETPYGASPTFRIAEDVYAAATPTLLDFFQASLQQGSAYHADYHQAQSPAFPMMADGSFLMEADQAAIPLMRLGSAYEANPGLFSDQYTIRNDGAKDIQEYILVLTEYLETLQDHDGTLSVPQGWNNDFQCPWDFSPSQPRYNDEPNPCMSFLDQTNQKYTGLALLGYTKAIPALQDLDGAKASEVLGRAIATKEHYQSTYGTGGEVQWYAAALFDLYEYTGDEQHLREAHSLRDKVGHGFDPTYTNADTFYWADYVRHEQAIKDAGLEYPFNGQDPRAFFGDAINADWSARESYGETSISSNGELVYEHFSQSDFQNSRYMLLEALVAAKAQALGAGSAQTQAVADQQLSWLTGQNSVQMADGGGELRSISFIHGIGDNPTQQHTRLAGGTAYWSDPDARFQNGERTIKGWISGAYDSPNDGDAIFNHYDHWDVWRYTETTNEMVAAAVELMAYLDAQRSGASGADIPIIQPSDTSTPPQNQTAGNQTDSAAGQSDNSSERSDDSTGRSSSSGSDSTDNGSDDTGRDTTDTSEDEIITTSRSRSGGGGYVLGDDVPAFITAIRNQTNTTNHTLENTTANETDLASSSTGENRTQETTDTDNRSVDANEMNNRSGVEFEETARDLDSITACGGGFFENILCEIGRFFSGLLGP